MLSINAAQNRYHEKSPILVVAVPVTNSNEGEGYLAAKGYWGGPKPESGRKVKDICVINLCF